MAVCGKVVDCSTSENIRFGEGYGKLWAGCDATHALATLSLNPADANKLDWKIEDLTDSHRTALAGWYKHFTTKYEVIGKLKEYEGWDFTAIFKESKGQTPFGAKAEPDSDEEKEEEAQEEVHGVNNEGQVFAKGDKVSLIAMEEPELEGEYGILQGYNPAKGGFEVSVEGDDGPEIIIAKPKNLIKVKDKTEIQTDIKNNKEILEEAKPKKERANKLSDKPNEGVVFAKGDKVSLIGMDQMEMDGEFGILKTYNPEKGGFEIEIEDKDGKPQIVVAKPNQLVKVEAPAEKKEEKKDNSKGLGKGTRVWIFGCERFELEGRYGTIKAFDEKKGAYTLLMDHTQQLEMVMSWQVVVAK